MFYTWMIWMVNATTGDLVRDAYTWNVIDCIDVHNVEHDVSTYRVYNV